jgi:hypothetical protein
MLLKRNAQGSDNSTMSITPLGIGFVVLVGTIIGLLVNHPLSTIHGCLVIGAIHGVVAAAASWAAFSVYDYFFAGRQQSR